MGFTIFTRKHEHFRIREEPATLWERCAKNCLFYFIVTMIMILFTLFLLHFSISGVFNEEESCSSTCYYRLVETIPENVTFPKDSKVHLSTYDAWSSLLDGAQEEVDMAVFYWSLTSEDVEPNSNFSSAQLGENLLSKIMDAGLNGSPTIRIAQNAPTSSSPQNDSHALQEAGAAQVVDVNIKELVGGVLHTKLWVVDEDKFYLGSANMDFRSLTQVKELGVLVWNCSCLARDVKKIFEQYFYIGEHNSIPSQWPSEFSTKINRDHPLTLTLNGSTATAFVSSSPPPLTPGGRVDDIDAIISIIDDARETVDVAVMDYFPRTLYSSHVQFWPDIDNALRRAALDRGVRVRLLASHWQHSRPDLQKWLLSLAAITSSRYPAVDVQAKLFVVPAVTPEQEEIPFGRVNHNKYMVTDRVAYIGTSNWSKDYFTNTGGVGLVVNDTAPHAHNTTTLRTQLQDIFNRDWNSVYAKPIAELVPSPAKETTI